MKMKNLVAYAMLAFGAVAAPFAAMAVGSEGDIAGIHVLSDDAVFPNDGAAGHSKPLHVGQKFYILVRMLNEDWKETYAAAEAHKTDPSVIVTPHPWYFKPTGTTSSSTGDAGIGIWVGSRADIATFAEFGPQLKPSGINQELPWYTDLYFEYTVQAGDLGLPIQVRTIGGGGSGTAEEFELLNVRTANNAALVIWPAYMLTNDSAAPHYGYFGYGPQNYDDPDPSYPAYPGEKFRQYDLTAAGVFVQTVDFDKINWKGDDLLPGDDWRRFPQVVAGANPEKEDAVDWPSITSEGSATVYVWSDDDSIAYVVPYGAGQEYFPDTSGEGRKILQISLGSTGARFKIAGVGAVGTPVAIYMSQRPYVEYTKVGDKRKYSVCTRTVRVSEPKPPSVSITWTDESGREAGTIKRLQATNDYEVAAMRMLRVSISKVYSDTEPLDVDLVSAFADDTVKDFPTNGYIRILQKEGDPTRMAGTNRVTIAKGATSATFYIYALGVPEGRRTGVETTITPSLPDPSARAFFTGGMNPMVIEKLTDQGPEIVSPREGATYSGREGSVIDGFDVEVADNWRDLQTALATNGYEIVVEGTGVEKFTTNGVHFTDGAVVTLPVRVNASGTALQATVKVKDPAGNVSTREVTINSTPKPKARVQFYADRNLTQPLAGNTFNEGEVPYAGIVFTEGKAPANMYAFFVPTDANATNLVECDAKTNGLKIAFGDTNSTVTAMAFLDGFTQVNPMKAKFAIRFLSTPILGGEGTPVDYTDDCGSPTFEVNAVNVSPTVDQVFLDGGGITDGETFHKVPSGIEKLYSATVIDPSRIDLQYGAGYEGKEVWVRWEYTDDYEGYETARANYAYSTNGTDGAEARLSFTYENTLQRVRLYALDKDDRAAQGTSDPKKLNWGKPLFTFYVDVAPTQRIIISDQNKLPLEEDGELTYLEDQKQSTGVKGDFYISLSEIPGRPFEGQAAQPIRVKLTLEQWGDGVLNIHTNYVYFKSNEKKEQPIRIDTATLNGGQASDWTLMAEVDMEDPTAKDSDGNPWSEHFAPAYAEVYVRNVDPVIDSAVAKGSRSWKESETNIVSAGEAVIVNWKITDITNDFYEADWKYDRFQIEWSVDSADTVKYPNPQVITNDWPRNKATGSKGQIYGDYRFNVPARDGYSRITMTVSDGDGGFATKEWWIYVSPAKRLKVDVFGPKATAQTKYKAAKGIGQGLVAAKGVLALCEQFVQTWEYDETASDADLWAWGYPATNTWAQFLVDYAIPPTTVTADNTRDEGKIPTYLGAQASGVPLNRLGNKHSTLDTTWYDWATHGGNDLSAGEYDNYFYRWVVVKAGGNDQGGGATDSLPAPTTWPFDTSTVTVALDSGDTTTHVVSGVKSYGTVEVEAIFSKELRPKDNLGDINADGIPDKIVELYGFGANIGEYPEDDLASLSSFNDDMDYLPNTAGSSIYSSLIPGLPETWGEGQEFTAVMEVRGAYADEGVSGLNDAAHLVGLSQQRLEPGFYDNDVEVRKAARDYSALEMMAWAEHGYAKDWSPERPTDPTKADTDEDKFPDGYEYYFWYRAHVGYIENGVHKYMTGRAYDPRNPGEGKFIPSVVLARLMDPRSDLAAVDIPETAADRALLTSLLATDKKVRDTDNDGLPDALEFEIGTNPFDFDTDGDGLPDGFEIMLGGTDPLLAETTPGISDAMRNFDGDAMAFTTPRLEAEGFVEPIPLVINSFLSFALVDPEGDTDGLQWYVSQKALDPENVVASAETKTGISFALQGDTNVLYVTSLPTLPVVDGRLACDLLKSQVRTMVATNDDFGVEGELNVALMPTLIPAGTPVTNVTEGVEYRTLAFEKDVKGVNAAWVYGRNMTLLTKGENLANMGGFGMLTIGRYQDAPAGVELAALPTQDDDVAYLHHFVYQEFGFDPRTAWNANTPLAPRWGTTFTVDDGEEGADTKESTEVIANNFLVNYHYAGIATRTREFTLYDEFLVMSFFLNNGKLSTADVTPTQAMPWEKIWSKFTTNGQGPKEPNWEQDNEHFKGRTAETNSGENGADTDRDGVPDGWELYVMAGPKIADEETKELRYNLVAPYNDGFYSSFGPFVGDAKSKSMTDNNATGGRSSTGGDGDGLTEWQEYAGTDSCDYYSGKNQGAEGEEYAYSETIVRPPEHEAWLNKFFPTDPWNSDTDGDGLTDANEAGAFKYGKPVDDYKHCCFAGGGLNPLSVDTDRDGLPDPWEKAFAGHAIYTGSDAQKPKDRDGNTVEDGNPLQGLCDGMDGTVFDAYTSPHVNTMRISGDTMEAEELIVSLDGVAQVVDRDYDHDGLENWQEYMTAAMRCWRYDDPVTGWDFTPDSAYFNPMTGEFDLGAAMAYTGISDPNEFWYRTLFDRSSKWYNPHFVTGTSPCSQYFSRVTNGWDQVFTETGTYYMFPDRNNDALFADIWANAYYGMSATPSGYICTSPILADTDRDGMDDYYELFHGLNPLIGEPDVPKESAGNPYDLVYSTWKGFFTPDNPMGNNRWLGLMPGNGVWDFTVHPWLDGIISADPDGDDIRNQDESIMPMVAPSTVWHHTDPTPLWMTDSSYNGSLVRRFYRMPCALGKVPVPESIVFEGVEYFLRDCDGFAPDAMGYAIWPFCPDQWDVVLPGYENWMYSFEENEGYDTDHDAGSDYEELQGKFRNKTDPQDADSPRRRQAMYFGGPENKSALQTMPFIREVYPRAAMTYQTDMQFLQYTVECWVKPESADDSTVIERTTFANPSHCADRKYVRRNFMIGIRNGKWYTAFDSNGTLAESTVEVQGATDAKVGAWTYVAATFDANRLTLFVNGKEDGYVISNLKPEYGSSAVVIYPAGEGTVTTNGGAGASFEAIDGTMHTYRVDLERPEIAFLLGASFANAGTGDHLLLTNCKGWGSYKDFFKGYVDEVRVWDGARPADEIDADFSSRKRYTREDALANRSAFYKQWSTGRRRYTKDGDGRDLDVVPELRFHWAFDSIPGADNAASVAQAPHGFLENAKPWYSRPLGYEVPWWSRVTGAYGSAYEGERSWVPWIPNTVTHLPRFDQTTIDSAYWSENYAGDEPGTYKFARTAEPVSLWTPMVRNGTDKALQFQTTGRRFWLSYNTGTNGTSTLPEQFEFTARHLNHLGDDLLPLGGAFARYVDVMWDGQGASSMWEHTGIDGDGDGLADWWQEYAEQNYREGVPEGEDITWDTMIWYEIGGVRTRITAGEAYQRDLAKGTYVDANGEVRVGPTAYAQTAKTDGMIPDWWKELMKIDGEPPLGDLDNDGLNNYVEYMASELLPFRLNLDPRMARSDTVTLDYFRRIGRLYLGEMLTDHDQMEDHWERSLGNESIASAAVWDALKDGEEDGWTNFAENRYNGYAMSTLAQLVAHAMGDNEVLDAPIPSVRMKVRYNGDRPLILESQTGDGNSIDDNEAEFRTPALIVTAFSKNADTGSYALKPDAIWAIRPGVPVKKEVYLGGWEDRVVRGTMAPGNIDIGTLDIKLAQVPQSDLYSWTDESGTHISGTYAEFKEALDKNPDIIQNIQNFEWLSLYAPANEYTSADRAVTVTRDKLTQKGYIAVYGERVGTLDLTTGDFEFDMAAMNKLRVNYMYDGGKGPAAAWGYKEAIFKITYTATVPSAQLSSLDFSLAKSDPNIITPDGHLIKAGFVRGGRNSFQAFYDLNDNGIWDPGEPFGVVNDVEIGWASNDVEIELSDMSAVTPRVKLWGSGGESSGAQAASGGQESAVTASASDSDRGTRVGVETFSDVSNRFEITTAPAPKSRVRVVRYKVDKFPVYKVGVEAGVVLEKDFEQTSRDFLHEGDFLSDGDLDIDWKNLYTDVVSWQGAQMAACEVTNVTYLIVYNWDASSYRTDKDTNSQVKANATLVTRRFEVTRSVPTPCPERAVYNQSRPTFAWKIENEDKWASWFGTTYTAFKVRVKDESGNLVYDSGIRRLPAKDAYGVYTWTAPLYVGEKVPSTGVTFSNLTKYQWEVAVYNAKFKTDTLYAMQRNDSTGKMVFSTAETFRMNVTDIDASSSTLALRVCYAGPATKLAGRVRAEAFASPDFSGDPIAVSTLEDALSLSPSGTVANVRMIGLPAGNYFVRAYIDTNQNGVHDDWESWGYLNERDLASKPGIFNPVALEASVNPSVANVRKVLIEDCDTDGDWFPDVWEAEQNGDTFDRTKISPVNGDAELIGVNTNLDANLTKAMQGVSEALMALKSLNGVALVTGISPAGVVPTANGFMVKSEVKSETLTIVGLSVDAANGRVLLKVGAETTANVDPTVASFLNVTVRKGASVTVKVEYAETPAGPWTELQGVGGTVTVDRAGADVEVKLNGELPSQGYFRAKIVEK